MYQKNLNLNFIDCVVLLIVAIHLVSPNFLLSAVSGVLDVHALRLADVHEPPESHIRLDFSPVVSTGRDEGYRLGLQKFLLEYVHNSSGQSDRSSE